MTNNNENKFIMLTMMTMCSLLLFINSGGISVAAPRKPITDDQAHSFQRTIDKLRNIINSNNYSALKHAYIYQEPMRLGQCNTDVGLDLPIDDLIKYLSSHAKNTRISINNKSSNSLIETEGWDSEYPYIYFYFTRDADNWKWLGVCEDISRSLDFATSLGGRDRRYDGPPKLPRKGPRIFQDEIALLERIKEIIEFKAFDAIKPYAVNKTLTFGQCTLEMMEKDKILGKKVPVQEIIEFLKRKEPDKRSIVPSGIRHKTYYETTGWDGEYPYIAFWFSEEKKGWELAGVSYCKTKHFDLFPPLSPLK